jgi:multiple sugar transport system substrate-binding protein
MNGSRRGRLVVAFALLASLPLACRRTASDGQASLHFVSWKPDQPAVWDEAVHQFESQHPGLTVVREIGPHSSTAFHDLVTQKLKNRDPGIDVFFVDVVWLAEFAAAGWTLPLEGRFGTDDRADFLAGTIRASTWNGAVYGVPAFVDAGMLYYRKDLLDKHHLRVPATWQELESAARRIVAAEKSAEPDLVGYSGQFKQYEGLVCDVLEFVAGNGGGFVDESRARATLRDTRTLDAIRWLRDRVVGDLAPRSVLTYQEPESLALFLQGLAVFHRNWPYAWDVTNDARQSRVVGKVGMAPLPHFAGGESRSALGGWLYAISAFSTKPDAAWSFIEFMTSAEMQKYFAERASLAPTRARRDRDPEMLARNPRLAAEEPAFRSAVPRPVTPMYPAVSGALQRFFSTAISTRDADVERLAAEADAEIDGYLALTR